MKQLTESQDLHGKWAVITGASSGLGMDFTALLAGRGCSLVLVARRQEKLEELRSKLASDTVQIHLVSLDLARRSAPEELFKFVQEKGIGVDFLINNAGFGKVGPCLESTVEVDEAMLHLNARAPLKLTKIFVRDMLARGTGGRVLNVASAIGFRPSANFAAYAASKAYLLNFSQAFNIELEKTNVTVSTLCPGMTRTEFFKDVEVSRSRMEYFGFMDSLPVAREGIEIMMKGKSVRVCGWRNRLMLFIGSLMPRTMLARITGALLAKT